MICNYNSWKFEAFQEFVNGLIKPRVSLGISLSITMEVASMFPKSKVPVCRFVLQFAGVWKPNALVKQGR